MEAEIKARVKRIDQAMEGKPKILTRFPIDELFETMIQLLPQKKETRIQVFHSLFRNPGIRRKLWPLNRIEIVGGKKVGLTREEWKEVKPAILAICRFFRKEARRARSPGRFIHR